MCDSEYITYIMYNIGLCWCASNWDSLTWFDLYFLFLSFNFYLTFPKYLDCYSQKKRWGEVEYPYKKKEILLWQGIEKGNDTMQHLTIWVVLRKKKEKKEKKKFVFYY